MNGRVERRLDDETEIWLTTVRADGQPQSSPVGFRWDGSAFLVLSQPDTPKVRNVRANPRVALHLELDRGATGDQGVLTVEGTARIDPEPLGAGERAAYLDRYAKALSAADLTPEDFFATFSTVIRIEPTRTRSY